VRFSFDLQDTHDWHVKVRIVWHDRLVLGNLDIMRTVGLAFRDARAIDDQDWLNESVVK
jgi:hypothetical protein